MRVFFIYAAPSTCARAPKHIRHTAETRFDLNPLNLISFTRRTLAANRARRLVSVDFSTDAARRTCTVRTRMVRAIHEIILIATVYINRRVHVFLYIIQVHRFGVHGISNLHVCYFSVGRSGVFNYDFISFQTVRLTRKLLLLISTRHSACSRDREFFNIFYRRQCRKRRAQWESKNIDTVQQ